jgi:4-hydroxy-2-oxoheptanedioate aldolase
MSTPQFDLRARLAKPEPFLFSWMSMPGAILAGQLARLPLDGVTIDMQHGMMDFTDTVSMVAAINANHKPAIIRTLWNEPGIIGQSLDCGAAAVIVPMINSVEEARALVKAAKYPPIGGRSWGGYTALQAAGLTPGQYLAQANKLTMAFAMIETQEALDRVDEIAAVPGLDGLFVGPSDLSIALTRGAGIDKTGPHTLKAMEKIAAAAKTNNLVAGAFAGNAETIKIYAALGYSFFAAVVDVDLLQMGTAQLLKDLKSA